MWLQQVALNLRNPYGFVHAYLLILNLYKVPHVQHFRFNLFAPHLDKEAFGKFKFVTYLRLADGREVFASFFFQIFFGCFYVFIR
nr:MAG: hypothetical protein [Bacteriophage sp.]